MFTGALQGPGNKGEKTFCTGGAPFCARGARPLILRQAIHSRIQGALHALKRPHGLLGALHVLRAPILPMLRGPLLVMRPQSLTRPHMCVSAVPRQTKKVRRPSVPEALSCLLGLFLFLMQPMHSRLRRRLPGSETPSNLLGALNVMSHPIPSRA